VTRPIVIAAGIGALLTAAAVGALAGVTYVIVRDSLEGRG
jgi:hypothetical protein